MCNASFISTKNMTFMPTRTQYLLLWSWDNLINQEFTIYNKDT